MNRHQMLLQDLRLREERTALPPHGATSSPSRKCLGHEDRLQAHVRRVLDHYARHPEEMCQGDTASRWPEVVGA